MAVQGDDATLVQHDPSCANKKLSTSWRKTDSIAKGITSLWGGLGGDEVAMLCPGSMDLFEYIYRPYVYYKWPEMGVIEC